MPSLLIVKVMDKTGYEWEMGYLPSQILYAEFVGKYNHLHQSLSNPLPLAGANDDVTTISLMSHLNHSVNT